MMSSSLQRQNITRQGAEVGVQQRAQIGKDRRWCSCTKTPLATILVVEDREPADSVNSSSVRLAPRRDPNEAARS